MVEVEMVLAACNELGEGPRLHSGEQAVYWVDIEAGNLLCIRAAGTGIAEAVFAG